MLSCALYVIFHAHGNVYSELINVFLDRWDCGVFMIKYADFYSRGLGLHFNQVNARKHTFYSCACMSLLENVGVPVLVWLHFKC